MWGRGRKGVKKNWSSNSSISSYHQSDQTIIILLTDDARSFHAIVYITIEKLTAIDALKRCRLKGTRRRGRKHLRLFLEKFLSLSPAASNVSEHLLALDTCRYLRKKAIQRLSLALSSWYDLSRVYAVWCMIKEIPVRFYACKGWAAL